MKIYDTYQEAKIENPDSEIVTTGSKWSGRKDRVGKFTELTTLFCIKDDAWVICKPADYLPSLEWFFDEGHALISGDLISDRDGNVIEIGKVNVAHRVLDEGYVLRADALTETKVITETPEEKEAFDSVANNSELPNSSEWDGEGLPSIGVKCEFVRNPRQEEADVVLIKFVSKEYIILEYVDSGNEDCISTKVAHTLSPIKPESPEQKAERERLEAAYDLYCDWCVANGYPKFSFDRFKSSKDLDGMLVIVDKTNYRKEQ